MRRLVGMVAIVTGGAAGLGRAIAVRLAAEGARVVITDIDSAEGQKVAREDNFEFIKQDVTDDTKWDEVVRSVEEGCGRLDILVNNAGLFAASGQSTIESTRLDSWRKIFAVNLEGVLLGCQAAIPAMRRSGAGSIVNIASVAGMIATPDALAYGASKAAVRQLTKSVAQHCAESRINVRCNSVHPGVVGTAQYRQLALEIAKQRDISYERVLDEATKRVPLGDLTKAEDVAAAVAFLASADARHITGERIVVDGGFVSCDTYADHGR